MAAVVFGTRWPRIEDIADRVLGSPTGCPRQAHAAGGAQRGAAWRGVSSVHPPALAAAALHQPPPYAAAYMYRISVQNLRGYRRDIVRFRTDVTHASDAYNCTIVLYKYMYHMWGAYWYRKSRTLIGWLAGCVPGCCVRASVARARPRRGLSAHA